MFTDRQVALDFAADIVHVLDGIDTDGFHVKPDLEGVKVRIGDGVGEVRGTLDGSGYSVSDRTTDETKDEGWDAELKVKP